MRLADLAPVIAATWPAAAIRREGAFVLPQGAGGGQRVSAARLFEPGATDAPDADIDAAIAGLRQMGQPPLFMVLDHQTGLEARLGARGFAPRDSTLALTIPCADIAAPPPPVTCFEIWPPLAIQTEIWAGGGIGPERLAVMDRAEGPKTSLMGRSQDRPAGCAFVAVHQGIAMLHALEIKPQFRRRGLAQVMMRTAAHWAMAAGARTLGVLVTCENQPARRLYASLGFAPVGQYHYRTQTA